MKTRTKNYVNQYQLECSILISKNKPMQFAAMIFRMLMVVDVSGSKGGGVLSLVESCKPNKRVMPNATPLPRSRFIFAVLKFGGAAKLCRHVFIRACKHALPGVTQYSPLHITSTQGLK